jgi:hypothetical protein
VLRHQLSQDFVLGQHLLLQELNPFLLLLNLAVGTLLSLKGSRSVLEELASFLLCQVSIRQTLVQNLIQPSVLHRWPNSGKLDAVRELGLMIEFGLRRAIRSEAWMCTPQRRPQTMGNSDRNDRREYARMKVSVPVEIQTDAGGRRIRGDTSDLSLGGCYVETIFPFPIGTNLDLQLSIEATVLIAATVVTCDPQVGNGIRFIRMLPEDREALKAFLEVHAGCRRILGAAPAR